MKSLRHRRTVLVCALIFLFAGCGKAGSDVYSEIDADRTEQEASESGILNSGSLSGSDHGRDISWQASYSSLERQYDFALAADQLYGCYSENGKILLDQINKDDFFVDETIALPETSRIEGMAADQEGNIFILGRKEESAGLWRIDAEGDTSDYSEMELEDTGQVNDLLLKGVYTDQSGNLFVWCEMLAPEKELIEGRETEVWHWEDRVYIKDGQLKTVFYEKIADVRGTKVLSFQIEAEGAPVFVVKDSDGIYIQEIDVDRRERKDAVRLEGAGDIFNAVGGGDQENIVPVAGGFLYCQNNELYEYHLDTRKAESLLSLSTYGIFSEDILFLKKDGDVIEIIDNHGDSGRSEFISLALGRTVKKIVTLGSTVMVPDLERMVAEFNRYSGEFRVEIVDYVAREGNCEDAIERLKLDVVAGKAPDLITTGGMDYSLFSRKGVLADLYDFMREDAQLSEDMLVRSVAEACEDKGHLYSIAPAFLLHSMWGYGDVTKGKSGVTFEELFRLLEDSGKDINAITGFSADEPVLTRLCTVSMDEFVDWEKGTCSFDGDDFKKLLSFAKDYTGNDTAGTYSERIGNREAVMSVGIISSVSDYQIEKEVYGGDVSFIGYPVAEGSGTAVAFMGSAVAINALNGDQTGAWEFVKYYLLHGYDGQGFPVLQEQFDRMMAAAMTENYGTEKNGENVRYPKGYFGDGVTSIFVYAAAQEEIDAVRRLVESAGNKVKPHVTIQNIIHEEAEAYFAGQIDLDKTVEKIQSRISLILQESQ